jgi:hypothetical protein
MAAAQTGPSNRHGIGSYARAAGPTLSVALGTACSTGPPLEAVGAAGAGSLAACAGPAAAFGLAGIAGLVAVLVAVLVAALRRHTLPSPTSHTLPSPIPPGTGVAVVVTSC